MAKLVTKWRYLKPDVYKRQAVGTILTAFLLPFILVIVCLCGMMDAAADHNRAAVEWCFGDGAIPAAAPEEYAGHITQMRACFTVSVSYTHLSIAWAVYDAEFFGVAQRRRRIFLVADLAGHSAAEILFEREGLPGYTCLLYTSRCV